ncbi:MAG: hypothetical protein MN733_30740 [Nitrososphaera sp.]|nr:hypothetical protein [Nitrososphaera sp.]
MFSPKKPLPLKPGDIVQVLRKEEILATLDENGTLDRLPFMPEMLQFCGQRFTVYKRANKACDTIDKTGGRRLYHTVHLGGQNYPDGVRCDGAAHGGCQASCLTFWKEAWLRRVDTQNEPISENTNGSSIENMLNRCNEANLLQSVVLRPVDKNSEAIFRCQATQLKEYTEPLAWWDFRQYMRDITSGNVRVGQVIRSLVFSAYRKLVETGRGHRLKISLYNWYQSRTGGTPYPYGNGTLLSKTPKGELHLQPGELVRVKSYKDILATLNEGNRNQGLWFDAEMVRFCGGTYRVLKRVNRIIDEKKGRMLEFHNPCIILQNVYCRADISKYRLFCTRSIYPYWREIWLERINPQH